VAFIGRDRESPQIKKSNQYGSYVVDEKNHTFTFHVEGALVRTLIGKELPRVYEFKGNQLIVKSARPDEHWKVVREHY
jgi:hypothetical protein